MMKTFLSLILLSFLSTSCSEVLEWKDRVLSSVANTIPWEFETSMGDQLLPSILAPEFEIKDEVALQQLENLLKPLITQVSQPQIKLHISKEQELNAFAIPGGHLIFNRGMLLAAETPEEILGVAAHEIAHASERHTMRTMIQGLSIYAAITLFLGDVSGLGAILIDQGQALVQNGFSRAQERSADAIGVARLINARINPEGMIRFFQRLEAEGRSRGQNNSRVSQFMSTHPLTAERIEEIKAAIARVPESERKTWKPVAFDLKAFQKRLGG